MGLPQWRKATEKESVENTDVVVWHTFGLTHFPAPEDFPVMPVEPFTLLLRPRNFFTRNPVLDVPPSYSSTPSQVREGKALDSTDKASKLAFGGSGGSAAVTPGAGNCCGKKKGTVN